MAIPHLNSAGGLIDVAADILGVIINFELDTLVIEECVNACVRQFLAGINRQMD